MTLSVIRSDRNGLPGTICIRKKVAVISMITARIAENIRLIPYFSICRYRRVAFSLKAPPECLLIESLPNPRKNPSLLKRYLCNKTCACSNDALFCCHARTPFDQKPHLVQSFRAYLNTPDFNVYSNLILRPSDYIIYKHICTL
ncbi:hypothetical protein SDC9_170568 [bioreactor metagenome]|uniref:Uncharacterized protein n=1 Tax=bioreactor metagenome TaxID=1076179 RepID=A0A645GAW7_9ZZZZ